MNFSVNLIAFISISLSITVNGKHKAPTIQTAYGPVQGSVTQYRAVNVLEYKGIPYAKAPINENRFMPPKKPDPWVIPYDATEYGPICMQPGNTTWKSEDCLFINIFVSEKSYHGQTSLPVMVFIHGGGHDESGNLVHILGPNPLAALNEVVLVSFNRRSGVFGFLYPGSDIVPEIQSNLALRDQIFALQWVKENINSFRGDPSRVTLFGTSAGSFSIGFHLLSSASRELFTTAIMVSGAPWWGQDQRNKTILGSRKIIEDIGCYNHPKILSCLQNTDSKALMEAMASEPLYPVFGDDIVPLTTAEAIKAGKFNMGKNILAGAEKNDGVPSLAPYDISLINGIVTYDKAVDAVKFFTKNQSTDFFINHYLRPHEHGSSDDLKQAVWEFVDDLIFKCPTYVFASSIANATHGIQPMVYAFEHIQKPKTSNPICMNITNLGPCHADDLPFVFGDPFRNPELYDREDMDLSHQMMKIWTTFAMTGSLPSQGTTDWSSLGPKQEGNYVMELNSKKVGVMHHDKLDFCIVNWNNFLQVFNPN